MCQQGRQALEQLGAGALHTHSPPVSSLPPVRGSCRDSPLEGPAPGPERLQRPIWKLRSHGGAAGMTQCTPKPEPGAGPWTDEAESPKADGEAEDAQLSRPSTHTHSGSCCQPLAWPHRCTLQGLGSPSPREYSGSEEENSQSSTEWGVVGNGRQSEPGPTCSDAPKPLDTGAPSP